MPPGNRHCLIRTQLPGFGGSRSIDFGAERVLSLPDALAQAFMSHLEQGLSNVPRPISKPLNGNGNGGHRPPQPTFPTPTVPRHPFPPCAPSAALVLAQGPPECTRLR